MKKIKNLLQKFLANKFTKNDKGIALVLTMGILSLMLLMAMTFAAVTKNSHSIASIYDDMTRARLLAESGMARCLGYMRAKEKSGQLINTFYSGQNANPDYDGNGVSDDKDTARMKWMLSRFESDTEHGLFTTSYRPLKFEDIIVDSALIGRVAYIITRGGGLLEPSFCVEYDNGTDSNIPYGKISKEQESIIGDTMRYGRFVSDVNLENILNTSQMDAIRVDGSPYSSEDDFWGSVTGLSMDSKRCFYINSKSAEFFKSSTSLVPRFNLHQEIPSLPAGTSNVDISYTEDNEWIDKITKGIQWIDDWTDTGEYKMTINQNKSFVAANIKDALDADSYRTFIANDALLGTVDSTFWIPDDPTTANKNYAIRSMMEQKLIKYSTCMGVEKDAYYINEIGGSFGIEQDFTISAYGDTTVDSYIVTAHPPQFTLWDMKSEIVNFGSAKDDEPFLYPVFAFSSVSDKNSTIITQSPDSNYDGSNNDLRFGGPKSYDAVCPEFSFTGGILANTYLDSSNYFDIPVTYDETTHTQTDFAGLTTKDDADALKTTDTTGNVTITYELSKDVTIGGLLFDGQSANSHLIDIIMRSKNSGSNRKLNLVLPKSELIEKAEDIGINKSVTISLKLIWFVYCQANDPRCDDVKRWHKDITSTLSDSIIYEFDDIDEQEKIIDNLDATFGAKNKSCTIETVCNGTDADLVEDKATAEPWEISTNFSRNGPMESLWEIGTIHRGNSWQTLNIDKYNEVDVGGDTYEKGDANILNQVKLTDDESTYGLVSVNIRDEFDDKNNNNIKDPGEDFIVNARQTYKALLQGLAVGTKYDGSDYGASSILTTNDALGMANMIHTTNPKGDYLTRAEMIKDWNYSNGNPKIRPSTITVNNDAEEEELIGKFINLTTTIKPTLALSVYAQSIRESNVPIAKNNKFGYDHLLMPSKGVSEMVTQVDLSNEVTGGGTYNLNDFESRNGKFDFTDDIIGEEQISVKLGQNTKGTPATNSSYGKWEIQSYKIITP